LAEKKISNVPTSQLEVKYEVFGKLSAGP